ncbi:MAG TPA: hypothetical protein VGR14_19615 [Verrucomicrobiae bacterium]|jgi:hypothetical protein|nr:hypothetical protein [Verrucomicrobiae bacterium]
MGRPTRTLHFEAFKPNHDTVASADLLGLLPALPSLNKDDTNLPGSSNPTYDKGIGN